MCSCGELILHSIRCIESFNPLRETPTTHLENYVQRCRDKFGASSPASSSSAPSLIRSSSSSALSSSSSSSSSLSASGLSDRARWVGASASSALGAPSSSLSTCSSSVKLDRLCSHNLDDNAVSFIREVFYSHERYSKFVTITVNGFYDRYAAAVSRSDRILYSIFVILVVFKLRQLTFAHLKSFILSQDAHKMHTLLSFLYDPELLHSWLLQQWALVYDIQYVRDELICGLESHSSQFMALISELKHSLEHAHSPSSSSQLSSSSSSPSLSSPSGPRAFHVSHDRRHTECEPFNLSQGRVRVIPLPAHVISNQYSANPIPKSTYTTSLSRLDEAHEKRKAAILDDVLIKHKQCRAFEFQTQQRAQLSTIKKHIQLDRDEQQALQAQQVAARRQRAAAAAAAAAEQPHIAPPKLTTAAILREEVLYRKMAQGQYEFDVHDEKDFMEWQRKMNLLDEKKKLDAVEQRKLANQKLQKQAELEKRKKADANKENVKEMNEGTVQWKLQRAKEEEALLAENQQRVLAVQEAESAVAASVAQVTVDKKALAKEIIDEKEVLRREQQRQRQEDIKAKKEMIRQIQALVAIANVRAKRRKVFDPSTSSGLGLLNEMSIVELKQRLSILQAQEEDAVSHKRERIQQYQHMKQEVLQQLVTKHQRIRKQIDESAQVARQQRKHVHLQQEQENQAHDQLVQQVIQIKQQQHQQDKRQQALQLAAELKQNAIVKQFYENNKSLQREKVKADLQLSMTQRIQHEQQVADQLQNSAMAVQRTIDKNQKIEMKRLRNEKQLQQRNAQRAQAQKKQQGEELLRFVEHSKKEQYQNIKQQEEWASAIYDLKHPYTAAVVKQQRLNALHRKRHDSRASALSTGRPGPDANPQGDALRNDLGAGASSSSAQAAGASWDSDARPLSADSTSASISSPLSSISAAPDPLASYF